MAKDDGKILMELIADNSSAIRAWQEMQNRVSAAEKQLQRLGQEGNKAGKYTADGWERAITKLGLLIGTGAAVSRVISSIATGQDRLISQVGTLNSEYDRLMRRFALQANLSDMAGAQSQILGSAKRLAVPKEVASEVGKALVSGGFESSEVLGQNKALDTTLGILQSMGPVGPDTDVAGITTSLMMMIKANKMPNTRESLLDVGRRLSNLYQGSDVQPEDIQELAGEVAPLKQAGMTLEQQMSGLSVLRDVMPGAEAATGLRNVVSRLATVGASTEKVSQLGRIGLKPEDVNFSDGDIYGAFERFGKALSTVDKTTQAEILKKVFEERGQSSAAVLFGNVPLLRERDAMQRSAAFTERIGVATSGPAARDERLKIQHEEELLKSGYGGFSAQETAEDIESIRELGPLGAEAYKPLRRTIGRAYGMFGLNVNSAGAQERVLGAEQEAGGIIQELRVLGSKIDQMTDASKRTAENTDPNRNGGKPGGAPAGLQKNSSE